MIAAQEEDPLRNLPTYFTREPSVAGKAMFEHIVVEHPSGTGQLGHGRVRRRRNAILELVVREAARRKPRQRCGKDPPCDRIDLNEVPPRHQFDQSPSRTLPPTGAGPITLK
jgi:hypothetical protein